MVASGKARYISRVVISSGGMDAIDAMHKAPSTSGTFDPRIAQSFQQIALVGAFVSAPRDLGP